MDPIKHLPTELVDEIIKYLPPRDRVHFGATCQNAWRIAVPRIYESMTLSTSRNNRSSFSALLGACRNGSLIKELTIIVEAPHCDPDYNKYCEECGDPRYRSSDSDEELDDALWSAVMGPIGTILRGTDSDLTPNLKTLNIRLPENYGDHYCVFQEHEEWNDKNQAMDRRMIKRLDEIFAAAAAKRVPTIKGLAIYNLPQHKSSVWLTSAWRNLIRQLQTFELSLYGGFWEIGVPRSTQEDDEFDSFIEFTGENIFNNLATVTRVKLECSPYALLGHHSEYTTSHPLPFAVGMMPQLQRLELSLTVVDHPLVEFLEGRSGDSPALDIILTNAMCFDCADFLGNDPNTSLTWREVFARLTNLLDEPGKPGIKSFTASFVDVASISPVDLVEELGDRDDLYILKELAGDKIIFPYVMLETPGEQLICREPETRAAFLAGHDQAEYDRFLARVEQFGRELASRR